jgi:hypothetical protein
MKIAQVGELSNSFCCFPSAPTPSNLAIGEQYTAQVATLIDRKQVGMRLSPWNMSLKFAPAPCVAVARVERERQYSNTPTKSVALTIMDIFNGAVNSETDIANVVRPVATPALAMCLGTVGKRQRMPNEINAVATAT